jgi:2,4-dienoyl-CoA reductase-like NADH-dependent reductase (Old Yellow Enzyme family)
VAITAKLNMTDGVRGGLQPDDSVEVARRLEHDRTVDALDLTAGSSLLNPMYLFHGDAPVREFAAAFPPPLRWDLRIGGQAFLREYPYRKAYLLDHSRRFRHELTLPLILLDGITRRETIDTTITEGYAFVAMARALLREPDLSHRRRSTPHPVAVHLLRQVHAHRLPRHTLRTRRTPGMTAAGMARCSPGCVASRLTCGG